MLMIYKDIVSEQNISPHIQFDITNSLPTYNIVIGVWCKCLSTLFRSYILADVTPVYKKLN